ncbi:MAG TPA: hypothetical protein VGJ20_41220 [Xanthobacteraceae bacterium]
MLELIVYMIFCVFTGLCGVEPRMGFFGTFVLALLVSPLVVLPMPLITAPLRRIEWRRQT